MMLGMKINYRDVNTGKYEIRLTFAALFLTLYTQILMHSRLRQRLIGRGMTQKFSRTYPEHGLKGFGKITKVGVTDA